jgi:hypothetical protein
MKLAFPFAFALALLCGCQRDKMVVGGSDVSQCEAAYEGSRKAQSRSEFMTGCAAARQVAICEDGSASFSDYTHAVCAHGGGVAEWYRVVDG